MLVKILFVFLLAQLVHSDDHSNGFGDAYDWASTLDEAIAKGKGSGKPVMAIIYASWCVRSQELKEKIAQSEEIQKLSGDFVFVNVLDEAEPKDAAYAPDGYYYPRVMFISNGKVLPEIKNPSALPKYQYYYYEPKNIAKSMKKVLEELHTKDETADPPTHIRKPSRVHGPQLKKH